MVSPSDRSYTRRDTVMFLACVGLSIVALFSPRQWGFGVAGALRQTVLAPLVWLQEQAEEGRSSRVRLRTVTAERDSIAYVVQFLPSLRAENERLRLLLGLSRRLTSPYVAAEVLHQAQATDGRMLLLSAGSRDGVSPFDPVVAPEGLIGVVLSAASGTSVVMTWAHPEFRVSAFTVDGNAAGIVAPSVTGESGLEFRGVPYRDSVPVGTLVLSSGLGGVYPKGIPVGTVTGVVREQAGWERVYRLRPAANPGSTAHVLILTAPRKGELTEAFTADSALQPRPVPVADTTGQRQAGPAPVGRAPAGQQTPAPPVPAPTQAPVGRASVPAQSRPDRGLEAGTEARPTSPKPASPQPAARGARGDSARDTTR